MLSVALAGCVKVAAVARLVENPAQNKAHWLSRTMVPPAVGHRRQMDALDGMLDVTLAAKHSVDRQHNSGEPAQPSSEQAAHLV
jgi:hypothetical protein